jgi:fructokinase
LICAAAPHVTVRYTVGAGDAFMAGLVAGLTKGASTLKTLEGACRLGAYVASHFGATPLIPRELVAELGY